MAIFTSGCIGNDNNNNGNNQNIDVTELPIERLAFVRSNAPVEEGNTVVYDDPLDFNGLDFNDDGEDDKFTTFLVACGINLTFSDEQDNGRYINQPDGIKVKITIDSHSGESQFVYTNEPTRTAEINFQLNTRNLIFMTNQEKDKNKYSEWEVKIPHLKVEFEADIGDYEAYILTEPDDDVDCEYEIFLLWHVDICELPSY
jgi:hypothetical protein